MSTPRSNRAFTLIELLIVTSIIALIGMAVFAAFSRGVAVWELGQKIDKKEPEVRFALEKIAAELRNSFDLSGIAFAGAKEQLSFSTYIDTGASTEEPRQEPGKVTYFFDGNDGALLRTQERYTEIFREGRPGPKKFISGLTGFEFGYYYFDPAKKSYGWMDSWEGGSGRPLGVRISLKFKDGEEERSFVKAVYFP
jgi:prepilin-type N-terminal cleavage/methylation domain-containing protein